MSSVVTGRCETSNDRRPRRYSSSSKPWVGSAESPDFDRDQAPRPRAGSSILLSTLSSRIGPRQRPSAAPGTGSSSPAYLERNDRAPTAILSTFVPRARGPYLFVHL